jgi:hypothetical protein
MDENLRLIYNTNEDPSMRLYGQPDCGYREASKKTINKIGDLVIFNDRVYTKQSSFHDDAINRSLIDLNAEDYFVLHLDDLLAIHNERLRLEKFKLITIKIIAAIFIAVNIWVFLFYK